MTKPTSPRRASLDHGGAFYIINRAGRGMFDVLEQRPGHLGTDTGLLTVSFTAPADSRKAALCHTARALLDELRAQPLPLGSPVRVNGQDGVLEGVDAMGHYLVRLPDPAKVFALETTHVVTVARKYVRPLNASAYV